MTNSETKSIKSIKIDIEADILEKIDSRAKSLNMSRKDFLIQCALSQFALDKMAALEAAQQLAFLNNLINSLDSDLQETFRAKEKLAWQHLKFLTY